MHVYVCVVKGFLNDEHMQNSRTSTCKMRVAKKIARIVRVQIIEIIGSIEDFEKRLFPFYVLIIIFE